MYTFFSIYKITPLTTQGKGWSELRKRKRVLCLSGLGNKSAHRLVLVVLLQPHEEVGPAHRIAHHQPQQPQV